jgi:hypothetical protein
MTTPQPSDDPDVRQLHELLLLLPPADQNEPSKFWLDYADATGEWKARYICENLVSYLPKLARPNVPIPPTGASLRKPLITPGCSGRRAS